MGLNPWLAWALFWQVMTKACNPFNPQQTTQQVKE
jgi:hypothetical protein